MILNFLPKKINICDIGTVLKRGDIYCLCLIKKNKKIYLKCSSKLLPLPLSDIAFLFNIPNKKFFDHSIVNEKIINNLIFKNNCIEYCVHDSLIVSRFVEKLYYSVSKYSDLSNIYSISGLALKIFLKNFNSFQIKTEKSLEFDNMLRPSYYGGRCEVFGNLKKNEKCFHFDFSGMYTNRLTEDYPVGEYEIIYKVDKIERNGFYFVEIYSDLLLPILPYRDEKSGKLLFPNGFFYGLYWCEELLLFIKNGGEIKKIHYCLKFNKFDYVFKDFANMCNEKRKESSYSKILWKLIPNSFIGRLGIKYENEFTLILKDNNYNPLLHNVICDKKINNNWIVRVKEDDKCGKVGNVMYPSIITSKARILWWKSAIEVQKNGGRILYCDTDSIFAAFDKKINPVGEKHGEVFWDPSKIDTVLDDACFASSKVYSIVYNNKQITKIKGISKKYINDYDFNTFKKNLKEGNKENFKTIFFEKKKLNIKISEISKIIDFSYYDKRIFNRDKTETKSLWIKKNYPI